MSATHPVVRYPFAEWIGRHSRLFGSVSYGWLGRPYVYLIGAAANEAVFANDQHFSNARAYKGLVPVDGPTSVIVSDREDHKRRRTLVRPGLHHKQIDGYVATMTATADEALDTTRPAWPSTLTNCSVPRSAARRCAPFSESEWPTRPTPSVPYCNH